MPGILWLLAFLVGCFVNAQIILPLLYSLPLAIHKAARKEIPIRTVRRVLIAPAIWTAITVLLWWIIYVSGMNLLAQPAVVGGWILSAILIVIHSATPSGRKTAMSESEAFLKSTIKEDHPMGIAKHQQVVHASAITEFLREMQRPPALAYPASKFSYPKAVIQEAIKTELREFHTDYAERPDAIDLLKHAYVRTAYIVSDQDAEAIASYEAGVDSAKRNRALTSKDQGLREKFLVSQPIRRSIRAELLKLSGDVMSFDAERTRQIASASPDLKERASGPGKRGTVSTHSMSYADFVMSSLDERGMPIDD